MDWDEAKWNDLIGDLYSSAVDQAAGARLPDRLTRLTGAGVASMWQLRPRDLAVVGTPLTNVPSEAVSLYQAHYYQYDPWGIAVQKAPFDTALTGGEIIDEAALARSVYYNEFAAKLGMFHVLGAQIALGETVGVVSILRSREAGPFDGGSVAVLQRAIPHIAGAFRLREHVDRAIGETRAEALAAALDGIGSPAAIVTGDGTVIRANAAFEGIAGLRRALTRRGDGWLVLRLGDQFAALTAGAASGDAGGKFAVGDGTQRYIGTVSPLAGRLAALAGGPGRVLIVLRPVQATGAGTLTRMFGMTAAEAAVTIALSEGLSPAEIARARDVQVSTVRTLLVRAQEKAGCRNLRDLVRVVVALG